MIKDTLEKTPNCQCLQMERVGSLTKTPQERTSSCKQHDFHNIWKKHKLTRTPPEIILQSNTRTIYDKEDMISLKIFSLFQ